MNSLPAAVTSAGNEAVVSSESQPSNHQGESWEVHRAGIGPVTKVLLQRGNRRTDHLPSGSSWLVVAGDERRPLVIQQEVGVLSKSGDLRSTDGD